MPEKMRLVEKETEVGETPREGPAGGLKGAKRQANEFAKPVLESIDRLAQEGANIVKSPETKVVAGVLGAGLAALIAASLIGVGELAVAGGAGYLAYRALTKKAE